MRESEHTRMGAPWQANDRLAVVCIAGMMRVCEALRDLRNGNEVVDARAVHALLDEYVSLFDRAEGRPLEREDVECMLVMVDDASASEYGEVRDDGANGTFDDAVKRYLAPRLVETTIP